MSDTPKFWWTPAMRRAWEERQAAARRREDERRQAQTAPASAPQSDDGFLMGLATGIPIPLTPMSVAGAAIHNSMHSSDSYAPSPASDGYSGSSSSYDSGSSSSGGSFD